MGHYNIIIVPVKHMALIFVDSHNYKTHSKPLSLCTDLKKIK